MQEPIRNNRICARLRNSAFMLRLWGKRMYFFYFQGVAGPPGRPGFQGATGMKVSVENI